MTANVWSARASAHAKVNLGLAVLARRGDGFHEIETAMARVGLADDVTVAVADASQDVVTLRLSVEGGTPAADLTDGGANLAHRAATDYLAARRAADPAAPGAAVTVTLHKRVPVGAGLGGGSADAGAVLRLLAELLPGSVDAAALAARLGSDVPFMLGTAHAALAKGRGERLASLDLPRLHLVLANPGFAVSAGDAYQALMGFTPRLRLERALERLAAGEEPGWPNGLQPGVLRLRPEVRGVLTALREAGLAGVLMSGSGPTCFGVATGAEHAARTAELLAARHPGWWVRADATLAGATTGGVSGA